MIIDQKIKLKSDGPIKKFTPTGLSFEDGSTLDADVVVFATGSVFSPGPSYDDLVAHVIRCSYGDARRAYVDLIKNGDLHDKLRQIWGFDDEGEVNGVAREIVDLRKAGKEAAGLWCMAGNLAMCRFHSKHVALRTSVYHCSRGVFSLMVRGR